MEVGGSPSPPAALMRSPGVGPPWLVLPRGVRTGKLPFHVPLVQMLPRESGGRGEGDGGASQRDRLRCGCLLLHRPRHRPREARAVTVVTLS